MTINISWQDLYTAAMLELDRAHLQGRIETARSAIRRGMEELMSDRTVVAVEETQAMVDALRNLQTLQCVEFRTSTPATGPAQSPAEG